LTAKGPFTCRAMSQVMANFVQPKYFLAYRALVLPQLKAIGLGDSEADLIVAKATEAVASERNEKTSFEPHVAAAHLALSTFDVVFGAKASSEEAVKVARETLLASQLFETSTHKVATVLSWNKRKHANKVARDFCKDQAKVLELEFNEPESTIQVKKCFYVDFFRRRDHPKLARVFCAAEKALLSSANAPGSGVAFEMERTIADGGASCLMGFPAKSSRST
jgi:hypothetical protein